MLRLGHSGIRCGLRVVSGSRVLVDSSSIVVHFDVVGNVLLSHFPYWVYHVVTRSFFRLARNDSARALSQHTPVRPRECRSPRSFSFAIYSLDVYWVQCHLVRSVRVPGFAGVVVGRSGGPCVLAS
jgi:hypothetical protein